MSARGWSFWLMVMAATSSVRCSVLVPESLNNVTCSQAGASGPPACPEGQTCVSGRCVACSGASCATGPSPLGGPCSTDQDCTDGKCVDWASLGETAQTGKFCSRPCCNSHGCDTSGTDMVCFATYSGSAMCIPGAVVGRSKLGTADVGASCGSGADCRSGWCNSKTMQCDDTCCSDGECSSGTASQCGVLNLSFGTSLPPRDMLVCMTPQSGGAAEGGACTASSGCQNNACFTPSSSTQFACTAPCCNSSECGLVQGVQTACGYVVDQSSGGFRGCALVNATPTMTPLQAVGGPCKQDSDCMSFKCFSSPGGTGYCSDACCSDADCAPSAGPMLHCLQVAENNSAVFRCATPP